MSTETTHPLTGRDVAFVKPEGTGPPTVLLKMIPRLVTGKGLIQTAVAKVPLMLSDGHIQKLPIGREGVWLVTADGFDKLNTVGAVSVVNPPTIQVGGQIVGNPHIEPDEKGRFCRGHIRSVGFGRNPMGQPMIIDRSMVLSLDAYLQEDLAGKAKRHPTAVAWGSARVSPVDAVRQGLAGQNEDIRGQIEFYKTKGWGTGKKEAELETAKRTIEERLAAVEARAAAKAWEYIDVDGDRMGLWIDTGHPVVAQTYSTFIQRRKFSDRLLQSMCRRNVLRAAFGFYKLAPDKIQLTHDPLPPDAGQYDKPKLHDARYPALIWYRETEDDKDKIQDILAAYSEGVGTRALAGMIGQEPKVTRAVGVATATDVQMTTVVDATGEDQRMTAEEIASGTAEGIQETMESGNPGALFDTAPEGSREKFLLDLSNAEQFASPDARVRAKAAAQIDPEANLSDLETETLQRYNSELSREIDRETS